MRWPFMNWLRGAPGRDDPAPDALESAPGALESVPFAAPDPAADARVEPRPAAWRELPPVQRTFGAAPLTAPTTAFARDLASRREPDPILEPLGHDVTSDGPAGLVSGIAVPLVQRTSAGSHPRANPPLPSPLAPARGRPTLQRGVTTVAALPPRVAAEPTAAAAHDASALEDAGVAASPAEAPAADEAPGQVVRVLPVARLATGTPAMAATRVADATAPMPVQALARVVTPGGTRERERPGVTETPPTAAIVPGATPTAELAAGTWPTGTDLAPAEPGRPDGPAQPVVARRTLGESRRLGLGAPLVGPPPSAARESGRPDLPVARRARSSDADSPAKPTVPAPPVMPPAAAAPEPLPRLVVARRSATSATTIATAPASVPWGGVPEAPEAPDSSAASDGAPEGAPAADADAADGSTPGDAAGPTRPLVGKSPIGVAGLARGDQGAGDDPDTAAAPGVGALHPTRASAPWPGVDMRAGAPGTGATSAPSIGGPAGTGGSEASSGAAIQRITGVAPASGGSPASVRSAATTSAVPTMAPLVASRAMRPGPTASMTASRIGPAVRADWEPSAVVAQLSRAAFTARGPEATPGPRTAFAGHPGAPSVPGVAVRWDERPVVARAAAGSGRGPTVSAVSTLPLVHAAAGTASGGWLDEGIAGRSADAGSWTPAAGFTTVAGAPGRFVQRAVKIDEVSVTADAAAGAAESGAAGSGAGESGAAAAGQVATTRASAAAPGGAGTDYEEIAEHVYDRIRARLTTELLLDRERAGTLVDG